LGQQNRGRVAGIGLKFQGNHVGVRPHLAPWWTDQTAGWIGGIAGSSCGLFGGLVGAIGGVFAPRARFKRLIYGLMAFAVAVGLVSLAGGLVALAVHQPYAVCYPLVLIGGIHIAVYGGVWPSIRKRYCQGEVRRLETEELRRGS
jgi:hypothetical protein